MKQEIQEQLNATNSQLDGLAQTITNESTEIKSEIERLSAKVDDMDSSDIIAALKSIGDRADAMKASVAGFVTPADTDPGPLPEDGTPTEQ